MITEGFTPEGLLQLDRYGEDFISRRLVYQRFSSPEQHGCAAGGTTNVIASLLAGAEVGTDQGGQTTFSDFQSERQCAAQQEAVIELWAKRFGRGQFRNTSEDGAGTAYAKSGVQREMGHQMARHVLHTVTATEIDACQRTCNLAVLIAL